MLLHSGSSSTTLEQLSSKSGSGATESVTLSLSRRVCTRLQHVQQHYNWDCGLACVLMVLKTLQLPCPDVSELMQRCGTTSIWTVDLAHLLAAFRVPVAFTTRTLGPNPAYAAQPFYIEHMKHDQERVRSLFQDASSAGISLQEASVNTQELADHLLQGQRVIIALMNKAVLAEACESPERTAVWPSYTGHFVVLSGYDAGSNAFLLHDPCQASGPALVDASLVDRARTSFGTDEDLLWLDMSRVQPLQQQQLASCGSQASAELAPDVPSEVC